MTVKEYDIIIPPTKIEELEELVSQLVGEETSEDDIFFMYFIDYYFFYYNYMPNALMSLFINSSNSFFIISLSVFSINLS